MTFSWKTALAPTAAAFVVGSLLAAPAVHASTPSPAFDITVEARGFNTNDSDAYKGVTFGYDLRGDDASEVVSSSVALYSGTTLLATNTSKSATKVNNSTQGPTYSSAFRTVIGTYTTSSTWNLGDTSWIPLLSAEPTKAVVTLTDSRGNTYTAENTSLADYSGGEHISWERILPNNVVPDPTTPTVVTDSTQPLVFEVDSGSERTGIDYSLLLDSDGVGDIPRTTIFSSTGVTVAIPATRITPDDSSWDGVIQNPIVVPNSSVSIPAESGTSVTVATAIEVGAGTIGLTFDEGVRLLLPDQADKLVGFERNGTFTQITTECAADTQTAGDALAVGGDCYISVGADMVIWTKHFTTFAAYSFAAAPAAPASPTLPATGANAPATTLWVGGALLLALGSAVLVGRSRVAKKR